MITISGITLDNVKINMRNEYYKTKSLEIIGGSTLYTINGKITVIESDGGGNTGSQVMSKLQEIRDLGRTGKCVTVNLDGYYSGYARIMNVNIEQGDDPSWVTQGAYSIELKTKIDVIPPNTLGIVADDCVTSIDISEQLQLGEDSHGYVYNNGEFSKTFVTFTDKVTVTCQPICPDSGKPFDKALLVLRKVLKLGPTNQTFSNTYGNWQTFLQSRNMETQSDGNITFSATLVLVPPCAAASSAFVDLTFGSNKGYADKSEKRTISGSVAGLISVPWADLIDLDGTCSLSKLSAADEVFDIIQNKFNDINSWEGEILDLVKQFCPPNPNAVQCTDNNPNRTPCLKPLSSNISKSRVEGSINFNFEWGTDPESGCSQSGFKLDTTVDIEDKEPIVIEHVIPGVGTLLQDLKTFRPLKYQFTASYSSDSSACFGNNPCLVDELNGEIEKLKNQYINGGFVKVADTFSRSNNSLTIKQDFIQQC